MPVQVAVARMKILQIVSSSRTSGAEKHVAVLSDQLRRRGHQVTTLCPPGGWLPSQLRALNVPTIELPMHGKRFWPATFSLARYAREQGIDIIHSHLTCATYHGVLTGRLVRLPVVSSIHVCTHDIVYRWLLPRSRNRIITVSDFVRRSLLAQGVPASRIRTIYNGTEFCCRPDPDEKAIPVRAELSMPPDAQIVGLFGHVDEFKGHPILVRAARQVVARWPRVYFVCVGAVEPQTQQALWEMAAEDSVAERFRFTGVRNDVQRLMASMDVVTLPSRYEACSMAIIEAMAMGRPVVATRAGGNPELIEHEETGLLIERTPEALAHALNSVLGDADRRSRMGNAARIRAEERFSAPVMASHVERLYEEILGCGPHLAGTH
jgi:glycosyltransferase involved in cell wall biosynthesis